MKTVLVLLVAFMAMAALASALSDTNGRPLCTATNVKTGKFRNNYDPTRYWFCASAGQDALTVLCDQETGYLGSAKKCVSWSQWDWEEPFDAPTA